ncbi:hypothetical protein HYU20_00080 [Candidatus Woesearchaeota archaeon]|nr:hypothetical protein [Candidatus Woesearchaeota archaeon]
MNVAEVTFMSKDNDDGEIESSEPEPEEEDDIYEEKERDQEEEDDEISPTEEAFMEGYEEEEKVAECAKCGKTLLEVEGAVEREFKGKHYRFCSEKCAKGYKFGK